MSERARYTVTDGDVKDPRMAAVVELIGRTGASGFQIRYSDDEDPTVWMAIADYTGPRSSAKLNGHEVAAALSPLTAAFRLADLVVDGATCVHCGRPTAVDHDFDRTQPLKREICWFVYDPELQTYRRSCEGEAEIGRNDPCPCGSGLKFKRCHGVSKAGVEHG